MPIKAILFDLDGTLIDSNDRHVQAWEQVFHDMGVSVDRQAIHRQIGKGTDMLVPAILPGVDEATQQQLGDAHGEIFRTKFLDEVKPFPRARDLLARAHAAERAVVLASSASRDQVDHYLDLLDARDLVSATTSADDVTHTKPAPDIFAAALRKVPGCAPDEAVVVGDSPYDMEAAGRCGIAAVALRSGGFEDAVLRGAGATCLFDDAAALLDAFDHSPLAG